MFDLKRLVLILAMMFILVACGQKGDLYQPEAQAPSIPVDSLLETALV